MSGTGERFFGIHTIYGAEFEHDTPYMTRAWVGRLRLHIFHRPDNDPDCHDHPWDFWTFPLTSYVEEVAESTGGYPGMPYHRRLGVVRAWRISHRPAEHCHRVMGRYIGGEYWHPRFDASRKIVTIVWRGTNRRRWGFLKNRDDKWCWIGWRDYVFGGGKHAPCEPEERE